MSFELPVTLPLMVVALAYVRGWHRLRSSLSGWHLAAFLSGVFAVWAAVGSPLAALHHQLLTAHMVQHLLLMTVAAPLILLGAPAIVLLRGIPRRFLLGISAPHPIFCWLASTAAVIGWHVPALFELAMHSARWHAFEQASFFAAGLLFWWPVIQPWPSLGRLPRWFVPLYLFLATLPCDALSAFLTFCDRVVYPHYAAAHLLFDFSPLGDQEFAGALMWVWVTFVYLIPAIVVTLQMLSPQRRASNAEIA
jgi:putative membrane protein